jgi:ERF superfamily
MTTAEPEIAPGASTAERIRKVMAEIGDIPKNGWNSAQSYAFRKMDDVAVRVRDCMSANGLICIPTEAELLQATEYQTDKGKRGLDVIVRETYHFISTDDPTDVIPAQIIGEGSDTQDKATTKALTAAYKYLLLQSFAIGEGDGDGDAQSGANGNDEPESNSASPEEIDRAKAALALAHPDDLPLIRSWCLLVEYGSLSKGHVDRRQLPGFFALLDALAKARLDSASGT